MDLFSLKGITNYTDIFTLWAQLQEEGSRGSPTAQSGESPIHFHFQVIFSVSLLIMGNSVHLCIFCVI
jgi:hypothetical protein